MRIKKTIPYRLLIYTISSFYLLLYFHCLCQRIKQSCHLRISQHLHQQLCIHSIRHRNRTTAFILLFHLRIEIFLIIKGILHKFCILPSVLIQDMSIYFRYHIRLSMAGVSLDCFNISTT